MNKKTTKSASKPTNPMNLLRGAIGQKSATPLRVALDAFKAEGLVANFGLAYVLASQSVNFPSVFSPSKRINQQAVLGLHAPLSTAPWAREVAWAAVAIYFRRELVAAFVGLRRQFFQKLVNEDFSAAERLLDEIVDQCGESLWVLENRIALLTVSGGFERQKKFVQALTKERGRSNVSFFASHFGERNEPRVTAVSFIQQFEARAKTWGLDEATTSFLSYKLTNRVAANEKAYATILSNEGAYSIIDLYESLLDLIRRAKGEPFSDAAHSIDVLNYVEIDDPRIARLKTYLSTSDDIDIVRYPESTLAFERGDLQFAAHCAENELRLNGTSVLSMLAQARVPVEYATDAKSPHWIQKVVASSLRTLYTNAPTSHQASDDLRKLALNLRHSDFALELLFPVTELTKSGVADRRSLMNTAFLFAGNEATELKFDREAQPVSIGTGALASDAQRFARMLGHICDKNWSDAFELAGIVWGAPSSCYRTVATYLRTHLLERMLKLEEAIEESVRVYIENPSGLEFTPLRSLIRSRGFRDLKGMKSSPSLASAFYIYAQHTGRTEKEVALKVAWKQFLDTRAVGRPSEMVGSHSLSREEIFFLSQVCKQETMELGGAFTSQMDLDRERLQICVNLAQVDQENRETYDQEIVDLTRRISIEEAVEYLESSRVYVDEIGITNWAKKNLESQFFRYIDYLRAGMFTSVRELEDKILKIATTAKNRRAALESYLDHYDVSAESLLEDIIRQLATAFLSRPRFGLDAFLSSRVRHGSFVGYLRGPLELKRLVTKKNAANGKYIENSFTLDRWAISSPKERNSVNGFLASFSASIDALLDEAVQKYLHVRSKARPDGMVTFGTESGTEAFVFKRWLVVLKSSLHEQSTLEDLVAYCFENFFWPSVRLSLKELQQYVRTDLGNEMLFAIEKFSQDVRGHLEDEGRNALLRDKFHARQEVKKAIERVAQWFDTPNSGQQAISMTLQRAIEIGLQSTQYARPSFSPSVTWDVNEAANVGVAGPAIGVVNDIAFLIFENISKHSGFEEADAELKHGPGVLVSIDVIDGSISLRVVSEISPRKDAREVQAGIASAKLKIANNEFESVTQSTHGTGLVRLAMNSGLMESRDGDAIDFGLDEEGRFYVRVLIARGVVEYVRNRELAA